MVADLSKTAAGFFAATALISAPIAVAHHSRAMFEMTRNITLRGIVNEYHWQNPHSTIVLTVPGNANSRETVGKWTVEASAIALMTTRGWTPTTYKPGDEIIVVIHPQRDAGSRLVLLFYALQPDGKRLYRAASRYEGEHEDLQGAPSAR